MAILVEVVITISNNNTCGGKNEVVISDVNVLLFGSGNVTNRDDKERLQ